MGFNKFDLEGIESYVTNNLRLFLSMAVGLLMFVGIVAVSVFFINVRGAEQTMVPDVRGRDLTSALLELQVKELYPRIQLRFSQSAAEKGLILEQSPRPGTIVRAGRRIHLVISQGVAVSMVGNYLGRNVEDVRAELMGGFQASAGLPGQHFITLREPFMYVHSPEPAGTILQQRPEPGTEISGPVMMELVVSRGIENAMMNLPNLVGLGLEDALEQISRTGIDFVFSLRPARDGERPGTVVSQYPEGNTRALTTTRIALTMASPNDISENEVFGLFEFNMGRNPYPLPIRLDSILPGGERVQLLSVNYAGGPLSVPFRQPVGSVLVLYMLNREMHREPIGHRFL